jgi:hypothetical protein
MKRVYRIVIERAEEQNIVLVLESHVITHVEKPSPLYNGRISILPDNSFKIWEYYPQVNTEESSEEWEEYFSVNTLMPVARVKSIKGLEVFIYKSEVEDNE